MNNNGECSDESKTDFAIAILMDCSKDCFAKKFHLCSSLQSTAGLVQVNGWTETN